MKYDIVSAQGATVRPQQIQADDLYSRFMEYCADRKDTTIKGYAVAIRHFIEWIRVNGIRQPQRADIVAYKNSLKTEISEKTGAPLAPGTQARYLRACKMFFKWASAEGLYLNIADNIRAPKIRQDNTHRDALAEEDVRRILGSIDRREPQGKRNYAMILLCVTGALRIIEIQRADLGDIKTIAGEKVLFIQGKGRDEKDEYKKLVPEVEAAIEDYLSTRPTARKTDPLFTGTSNRAQGCRITEPGISRIIKEVFRAAGYDSDRITAHSLRHTAVTMDLKAGATLQEAQHFARHASPTTTGIYAHNLDRAKDHSEQKVYNQIFGIKTEEPGALDQIRQLLGTMPDNELQDALRAVLIEQHSRIA